MIIEGNERILFIKRGDTFYPVACLTSNGLEEDVEMLPTTTRNAEGWRTAIPQLQGYTITFEGLQIPTIFQPDSDFVFQTTLAVLYLLNIVHSLQIRLQRADGFFIYISKGITSDAGLVASNPAGYILLGANLSETVANIVANLTEYNANPNVTYTADGTTFNIEFLPSVYQFQVTRFTTLASSNPVATYELKVEQINNPNNRISYDRLRQMKRNREKIIWRIMSPEIGSQFVDEGDGYITAISETAPVNQDATFSGTLTGWGVPRLLVLNVGIGTDGEFIQDGNDNIITP